MINFNRAYGSFRKGQDDLSRRRREIAQAFTEFKSANPYANMDDFQYFIDSNVDLGMGSNYLRGGAPSRQILEKIAGENEQNRIRAEKKKILADSIEQGEFAGRLQGAADKLLLENNGDTNKTMTALKSMFGDRIDYGALGINDDYIGKRYDELLKTRVQDAQNISNLTNYLNALSLSELENLDGSQLKGIFDLPEATSDTYLQSALVKAEEVKRNKQLAQNRAIMEMVTAAAKEGDADVKGVIRTYFGGNDISDAEFAKLTKNMDFSQYQARADEIRQAEDDAQNVAMNTSFRETYNKLINDPKFTAAMRVGNRDEALGVFVERLSEQMLPRHIAKFFGIDGETVKTLDIRNPRLNTYFDELYTSMQQYQQGALQEEYERQLALLPTIGAEAQSKNIAEMQKQFMLGMDKNVADALGANIGAEYMADQSAIIAAIDALNAATAENADITLGEKIATIRNTFAERGVPKVREYISDLRQTRMQDVPQTTMTMDEYVQGEVDDLTADFGELGNGITELVNALETAVTADTLIDIQRKLSARKDQLDRYVQANTEAHGNAVRSADGIDTTNGMPTGWLRYGEKLDVNKMNSVMNYINGEQARLQGIISAANTKIEQKMNELPEPQPTQDVIPPDAPENEVSALRNWYENAKEEGEYLQVINKLEQELAQDVGTFFGIPIWRLYTGEQSHANASFILNFLAAPAGVGTLGSGSTVKSWLANNPEELDKFMDDPKDYIMNSEVGKQYTDGLLNQ